MLRPVGTTPVRIPQAPAQSGKTVVFADPGDNGRVKKVTKGDTIRVELLVNDDAVWRVGSTSGSIGNFTDIGFENGRYVVQWSTSEDAVRPGRFTATFNQVPLRPRGPQRVFAIIADIIEPAKAKA